VLSFDSINSKQINIGGMKLNKPRDNYEIAKKTLEINNEISNNIA